MCEGCLNAHSKKHSIDSLTFILRCSDVENRFVIAFPLIFLHRYLIIVRSGITPFRNATRHQVQMLKIKIFIRHKFCHRGIDVKLFLSQQRPKICKNLGNKAGYTAIRCVLACTGSSFGQKRHFCMVSTRV